MTEDEKKFVALLNWVEIINRYADGRWPETERALRQICDEIRERELCQNVKGVDRT